MFYGFAVVAFGTTGFFVVQTASGSTSTAHFVGAGVFAFLGLLALAVGSSFRAVDRRLRETERTGGTNT
jgi:hypothetical protein